MASVEGILQKIDALIWGIPMITLILAVGVYLTVRLRGIQVRCLYAILSGMETQRKRER